MLYIDGLELAAVNISLMNFSQLSSYAIESFWIRRLLCNNFVTFSVKFNGSIFGNGNEKVSELTLVFFSSALRIVFIVVIGVSNHIFSIFLELIIIFLSRFSVAG